MKPATRLAHSKVHFIGIGGIGMCGLAELLHNMGAQVSGSDMGENVQTQRLEAMGIRVCRGHDASHLGDAEVVVYSSAVKETNLEYVEARRRKIPLIRRAEALAEIMRLKRGIAIAGTHGKTTTTSLTASVFLAADFDPTIVVGGRLDLIKSTAQLGRGDWLVAEADESDGSFLRLSPEIVIITNIDTDHLDYYKDFHSLQVAFVDFATRIPFYGAAIICGDDPEVRKVFAKFPKKVIYYGFAEENDVVLRGGPGYYELLEAGDRIGSFEIPLPGKHNALNATAAILAAREADISIDVSAKAISQFRGVDRRFQHRGLVRGIDFYDDYGHHPTEVKAVLAGFRERFVNRRIVVLFQPHRYSRTQLCWQEFCHCFKDCDRLFLLDIYAAGESPLAGIDSPTLAKHIEHRQSTYFDRQADPSLSGIRSELQEGDVFVTLGAGDVYKLGERLMESLAKS